MLQGLEFTHAYRRAGAQHEGIYGTTFFMLTGFHGFHVMLGAIMLAVVLCRAMAGHFTPDSHFAFEAVAWYWHFVDLVWLLLFVFVYWLYGSGGIYDHFGRDAGGKGIIAPLAPLNSNTVWISNRVAGARKAPYPML